MSILISNDEELALPRRSFLGQSGLMLSGAAVALLAGRDALAAKGGDGANDVNILNTALGAELEAIAAYQLGAESGLLQKPVLALATTFQGHHKEHADLLAKTVQKLGGKPVTAKAKYSFPTDKLKSQADVLRFAASLEQGAVSAYLGAVPLFGNADLAKAAASILGDEAMHWAVLRNALGETPVPSAFMA